jgi:hypothetical protein
MARIARINRLFKIAREKVPARVDALREVDIASCSERISCLSKSSKTCASAALSGAWQVPPARIAGLAVFEAAVQRRLLVADLEGCVRRHPSLEVATMLLPGLSDAVNHRGCIYHNKRRLSNSQRPSFFPWPVSDKAVLAPCLPDLNPSSIRQGIARRFPRIAITCAPGSGSRSRQKHDYPGIFPSTGKGAKKIRRLGDGQPPSETTRPLACSTR